MVLPQTRARGPARARQAGRIRLTLAAVGLGSNLGDRAGTLERALEALGRLPGTRVVARSEFVETKAVGPPQPDFLNAAALLETSLSPEALLGALLGIEAALGRVRGVAKGPRTLDLDLLLHGDAVRNTPELTLPHPELPRRAFVLEPLAAIAPALPVPGTGLTIMDLLAKMRR